MDDGIRSDDGIEPIAKTKLGSKPVNGYDSILLDTKPLPDCANMTNDENGLSLPSVNTELTDMLDDIIAAPYLKAKNDAISK